MSAIVQYLYKYVTYAPLAGLENTTEKNSTRSFLEFNELERALLHVYVVGRILAIALSSLLLAVILYYAYQIFFVPINRVRRLGSIGYQNHESCKVSKKEIANMIRKRRKVGIDLPPIYPNGWFRVIDSVQLKKGEVKEVSMIGKNLAVFRGQNGVATVMDTYCAHMGGNLGAGGRVIGNSLQCPFHGWKFGQDGVCNKIPYSQKIPAMAKVKTWFSNEVNGVIFMWYHVDGLEPQWEIPVIDEITNNTFTYKGRVEHHANTHIQDVPENGSDIAHLSHLHLPSVFSGVDLGKIFNSWITFANHVFTVSPVGSTEDTPHISTFTMKHYVDLFKSIKFFNMDLTVNQIGPGIVHLHMDTPLGKGVLVQTLTPIEPLHQVLIHSLYATWKMPNWISRIILTFEAIQVDRDVMIWNNKTFSARPMLVKEDALISKYRRWFSQFYSENSIKMTMKDTENLDW